MGNIVKCPKCEATEIVANKRGFNAVKGVAGAVVGGAVLGPLGVLAGGALAGTADQNEVYLTCAACGHQFQAGKGMVQAAESNPTQTESRPPTAPSRRVQIEW